jgi:hypothetical protein
MKPKPDYQRFEMLNSAWNAACLMIDDKGKPLEDMDVAVSRFLKRKACASLPKDDCVSAFTVSIDIAQTTFSFMRSQCGHNQPIASRRYQQLLALANQIENKFPQADMLLVMAACRLLENHWDR